ncbi:hypothetical protein CHS0354_007459 [Potamilus streckersoni]|uniref:Uncharacterized protein n=1 Tax=Potamilus streckersoni TaxID=2493646 RepID=A0AAE0SWU6_9BIVA|nr:hypothetical protein CHS0354_007459 [Potamilus streckersoni]
MSTVSIEIEWKEVSCKLYKPRNSCINSSVGGVNLNRRDLRERYGSMADSYFMAVNPLDIVMLLTSILISCICASHSTTTIGKLQIHLITCLRVFDEMLLFFTNYGNIIPIKISHWTGTLFLNDFNNQTPC